MLTDPILIGLDPTSDPATIVKLRTDSGRAEIIEWKTIDLNDLPEFCMTNPQAHIALPDSLINVHSVTAIYPSGIDTKSAVTFEIRQSLLDSDKEFLVDILSSSDLDRHLGMIIRREQLADFCRERCNFDLTENSQLCFSSRIVAQVHGWLEFCYHVDGDFVAYIDVSPELISVCLVYRRAIVDMFVLRHKIKSSTSQVQIDRSFSELKTLLDFHLASLFNTGITLPLTTLVVSGSSSSNELLAELSTLLEMPSERPKINAGFFQNIELPDQLVESSVLTAIGIALINSCYSDGGNVS